MCKRSFFYLRNFALNLHILHLFFQMRNRLFHFFYFFLTFFSFSHPLHEWQRLQQPHPSPSFFLFPIYKSARMIHKRIHPSTIRSNACNPLKRRFLLSDKPQMPSATQPHTEAPRQEMPACRFPSHASLPQWRQHTAYKAA